MKYILLFTLSPVQSFIAQARKTQDLYAASHILSELARVAAETAIKQGITLVFPQNTEGGQSFPNRFIGTIDKVEATDLQAKGEAIEAAVKDKFKTFAKEALEKVGYEKDMPNGFWEQINNHLDINWLFYPINTADTEGYKKAYKAIEPLMAALKNTRLITNHSPEAGRKCSLDGERNALFFGKGTNPNYIKGNNAKEVNGDKTRIRLKPNEGLSAVSLVKRAYRFEGQKEDFPSTAALALSYQIKELKKDNNKSELYSCYEQLFSSNYPLACLNLVTKGYWDKINLENPFDWRTDFDDQFLFKENLTEQNIPNPTQLNIAKTIQKQLESALTDKYYAIIAFDGDKMGKLLSGATRKDKNADLEAFQGKVSNTLMAYSRWIYQTLDKKQIEVVYTGGDDFLGFVNLHNLFEVVKTLRTEFDTQVNQALKDDLEDDKPFTFSMGITIAHYKTPLSIVLQTARDMEKKAKNEGNRDAFAIAALKHSGETHRTYFNWAIDKDENKNLPKWKALETLVGYFNDKECSDTFLRALEKEFYLLQDDDGDVKNVKGFVKLKNTEGVEIEKEMFMMQSELLRLATKSLVEGKKDKAERLKDTTWQLFEEETTILHDKVNVKNGIEAVKVALFIKRQTKDNGN